MYNCIVIDDEPIAIRVIKNHLSAFSQFNLVATFESAPDALPVLQEKQIDLIFCDIQMPKISGIDFVKSLAHPPRIIFTTAHRDYAVEAFELQVIDYLMKPISFERFTRAINSFLDHHKKEQLEPSEKHDSKPDNYIFLKADKKHYKVNLYDLLYFESLGDYVIAFTKDKKIVTRERIGNLANSLPPDLFIQIHRCFLVSVEKIESIGPGFVEINKKKLSVGRNYKKGLSELMQKG